MQTQTLQIFLRPHFAKGVFFFFLLKQMSRENVKNRRMILKFVADGIIYPLSDHPGMVFVQKPQEMAKEVLYLALCL